MHAITTEQSRIKGRNTECESQISHTTRRHQRKRRTHSNPPEFTAPSSRSEPVIVDPKSRVHARPNRPGIHRSLNALGHACGDSRGALRRGAYQGHPTASSPAVAIRSCPSHSTRNVAGRLRSFVSMHGGDSRGKNTRDRHGGSAAKRRECGDGDAVSLPSCSPFFYGTGRCSLAMLCDLLITRTRNTRRDNRRLGGRRVGGLRRPRRRCVL